MKGWIDVIRRVGDEDSGRSGAALTVSPGPDGFGVSISTDTAQDQDWFGKFKLTVSKDVAAKLGHALIAASQECEG